MIQIIVDNREYQKIGMEPIWLDDTASMVRQKICDSIKVSIEEMYIYVQLLS